MRLPKRLQRENKSREKLIVILGPNASGKSSLAIEIAKKFNGEIISADSRQVYKGLDIGSGKITKEEMSGITHYLIDEEDPRKVFTVSDFQKLAKKSVKKIIKKNKLPIVAGGTGFYIDALIYDTDIPTVPPQEELREKLERISENELLERLKAIDPVRAKSIDKKNRRRLIRAVEIVETTGEPVPEIKKKTTYNVLKIGIRHSDEILKERIKIRLYRRIKDGMIEEIENLHKSGVSWDRLDSLGLEYRYIARYLQGFLTKDEFLETLETEIWRYAKRQMTWFKKDSEIFWIDQTPPRLREASPSNNETGPPNDDETSVLQIAFPIVQDFLSHEVSPSSDQ